MRKAAGLTQQELADLVGTTQSVISRIEDSDYDNYNLETIRKIAEALHYGVRIEFIPENELVRN